MDTDSFVLSVNGKDNNKDLNKDKDLFDVSVLINEYLLFSKEKNCSR